MSHSDIIRDILAGAKRHTSATHPQYTHSLPVTAWELQSLRDIADRMDELEAQVRAIEWREVTP